MYLNHLFKGLPPSVSPTEVLGSGLQPQVCGALDSVPDGNRGHRQHGAAHSLGCRQAPGESGCQAGLGPQGRMGRHHKGTDSRLEGVPAFMWFHLLLRTNQDALPAKKGAEPQCVSPDGLGLPASTLAQHCSRACFIKECGFFSQIFKETNSYILMKGKANDMVPFNRPFVKNAHIQEIYSCLVFFIVVFFFTLPITYAHGFTS